MKKLILSLLVLGVLFSCQRDEVFEPNIDNNQLEVEKIETKADINKRIANALKEGRYFKWTELDADDLWTAIELSDHKVNVFWSMEEGISSKSVNEIEGIILSNESKASKSESPIFESSKTLNYLGATINNKETLINLLNSADVEYIEPLYEMTSEADLLASKSTFSSNLMQTSQKTNGLQTGAKATFNPPNKPSFNNSNISTAWSRGYDGKGITVAIIDNGPNKRHPLFGNGIKENIVTNPITNQTYTRTIKKNGFFKDNPFAFWKGWDGNYEVGVSITQGHATSMLSIVGGAPNDEHYTNIDDAPWDWGTGVAYGSNLISIRSSRSVFIGLLSSRIGVRKAFESLIGSDAKIISMSQGLAFWDEGIARAVRKNNDKLIFCAGGTFPEIVLDGLVGIADFLGVDFDRSTITLFPAKMEEVVSVTGLRSDNTYCGECFGKSDFVVEFNDSDDQVIDGNDGGSSSVATATTAGMAALIWSTNSNLTPDEVYQKMIAISENPTNRNPIYGHGRLDMSKFKDGFTSKVYVSLKGSNNRYASSENGQKSMICNRSTNGSWEKFELISLSDGKVALKGNNGKYVSSENGTKSMKCNRSAIGSWEKFTLINLSDGRIALKGSNGRFVSSENGLKSMNCNRSSIGSWEKFTLKYL